MELFFIILNPTEQELILFASFFAVKIIRKREVNRLH